MVECSGLKLCCSGAGRREEIFVGKSRDSRHFAAGQRSEIVR